MPLFLSRFAHDVKSSFSALAAAKSRTFLTMLGVIIGVMSVLAVTSVGQSAQDLILHQVKALGSDLINIIPGGGSDEGPPAAAFGVITTSLKVDDARAIADLQHVSAASPSVRSNQSVSFRTKSKTTAINGVTQDLPNVEDIDLAAGRFFGAQETSGYGRVAVLGYTVAQELYGGVDAVGQTLRIKGFEFEVIGVVVERGSAFFQDQDDQVFIPVTTAQRLIAGVSHVDSISVKVDDGSAMAAVRDDISRLLRRRHRIADPSKDDFTVRSTDQAAAILGNVTGAIKGFLLVVTAISLIVGGINIMNVMFVAVRERTKEIGLRKALGARPGRILTQFLIESAFISFLGGAIGILLGVGITAIAAAVVTSLGYDWQFLVPISGVVWSLAVAMGIGLVFGSWPAASAARLEPISALRYE